jgi:hypothetical protein
MNLESSVFPNRGIHGRSQPRLYEIRKVSALSLVYLSILFQKISVNDQ